LTDSSENSLLLILGFRSERFLRRHETGTADRAPPRLSLRGYGYGQPGHTPQAKRQNRESKMPKVRHRELAKFALALAPPANPRLEDPRAIK